MKLETGELWVGRTLWVSRGCYCGACARVEKEHTTGAVCHGGGAAPVRLTTKNVAVLDKIDTFEHICAYEKDNRKLCIGEGAGPSPTVSQCRKNSGAFGDEAWRRHKSIAGTGGIAKGLAVQRVAGRSVPLVQ